MPKDYYAILGVKPEAQQGEIVEAFYRLGQKYHPLVNTTARGARQWRRVAEAWLVLSDRTRRQKYDAERLGRLGLGARVRKNWKFAAVAIAVLAALAAVSLPQIDLRQAAQASSARVTALLSVAAFSSRPAPVLAAEAVGPVRPKLAPTNEPTPAEPPSPEVDAAPAVLPPATPDEATPLPTLPPLPTATPRPSPTPLPTRTPTPPPSVLYAAPLRPRTATPAGDKYPQPRLASNQDREYQCSRDLILSWSVTPDITLGPDEWFLVESRSMDHEQKWFSIAPWTHERSVTLHPIKDKPGCDTLWWSGLGVYEWRVRIIQGDVTAHFIQRDLSRPSETQAIHYVQ